MILDKEVLKKILTSELGYSQTDADLYLKDCPSEIHRELEEIVGAWLKDRSIADYEIEGVSIKEVMEARGYHFLMAIKAFNRLFDEDVPPEKRKQMTSDLVKPVPRS